MKKFFSLLLIGALVLNMGFVFADTTEVTTVPSEPVTQDLSTALDVDGVSVVATVPSGPITQGLSMALRVEGASESYVKAGLMQAALSLYDKDKKLLATQSLKASMYNYEYGQYNILFDVPVRGGDVFFLSVDSKSAYVGPIRSALGGEFATKALVQIDLNTFFSEPGGPDGEDDGSLQFEGNAANPIRLNTLFLQNSTEVLVPVTVNGVPTQGVEFEVYGSDAKKVEVKPTDKNGFLRIPYTTKLNYTLTLKGGQMGYIDPEIVYQVSNSGYSIVSVIALQKETLLIGALQDGVTNITTTFANSNEAATPLWSDVSMTLMPKGSTDEAAAIKIMRLTETAQHSIPAGEYAITYGDTNAVVDGPSTVTISATAVNQINVKVSPKYFLDIYKEVDGVRQAYKFKFLSHEAGEFSGKDTKKFAVAPGEIYTIQDSETGEVQTVDIQPGSTLTTLVIGSVLSVQRGNSPQTDSEQPILLFALFALVAVMGGLLFLRVKSAKKMLSLVLALVLVTSSLSLTEVAYAAGGSGNLGGADTGGNIGSGIQDTVNGVVQYSDDANINMLKMTLYFNMNDLPAGVSAPTNAIIPDLSYEGVTGNLIPLNNTSVKHEFTRPNIYNKDTLEALKLDTPEGRTIVDGLDSVDLGDFNNLTRPDYYNVPSVVKYAGARQYTQGLTLYIAFTEEARKQFSAPMHDRSYKGLTIPKGGEVLYDPDVEQPVSATYTKNSNGTFGQSNILSNMVFYDATKGTYRLFAQTPLNDNLRSGVTGEQTLLLTSTLEHRNLNGADYRFYDWLFGALGDTNARKDNIGGALRTSLDTYGATEAQREEIVADFLEMYAVKSQSDGKDKSALAADFAKAIDMDSAIFRFDTLMGYKPVLKGTDDFKTSFISASEYNKLALDVDNKLTATSWVKDREALMNTSSCWGGSIAQPYKAKDLNKDGVIDSKDYRWCSSTEIATTQHIRFGGKYTMMHHTTTLQPATDTALADTRPHESYGGKYDMPLDISKYGGWGLISMGGAVDQTESPLVYANVTVDVYDDLGVLVEADKVLGEVLPGWTQGDRKLLEFLKAPDVFYGTSGDGIMSSGTDSLTVGADTYVIMPNEAITYNLTSETEEKGININLYSLPALVGTGTKQTDINGFKVDLFKDLKDTTNTVLNANHIGDFYTAFDPILVGNYFGTKYATTKGAYFGNPLPDVNLDGTPDAVYTQMRLDIKFKVTKAPTVAPASTANIPEWRMTKYYPSLLPLTTLSDLLKATWNTYGHEEYTTTASLTGDTYDYRLSGHSTGGLVQRIVAGTTIPLAFDIVDNHDAIRNANGVATGTLNVRYLDGSQSGRFEVNSDAYYTSNLDATLLAKKRTGDITAMKAASWVLDNSALLGTLTTFGILNTNTKSSIGAETGLVTRTADVQYNIMGGTETFTQYKDWVDRWREDNGYTNPVTGNWVTDWDYYSNSGTDNEGAIAVNKNSPQYKLAITFDRFNPPATGVAPVVAPYSFSNRVDNSPSGPVLGGTLKTGFTTAVTPLTIVPEVPMLMDTPTSTHLIYAAGDETRSIAPNAYHMMYTQGTVKATAVGSLPVTDPKANMLNPLGDNDGEQLIYKGSEVSSAYETQVNMYAKSYVLDVANTSLRTTWGNSATYADDIHNTFLGQISADNGDNLRFNASNKFKIDGKLYGESSDTVNVPKKNEQVVNHNIVIRSGRVYSVDGDTTYATTFKTSPTQAKRDLYEALDAMGLIAPNATAKAPALATMQVGLGDAVNELKMVTQLNARASLLTPVVMNTSGWYYEDSTALVLKEYTHEYEMPNSYFSDALPMKINGLETPRDKMDFYTESEDGFFLLKYDLIAPSAVAPIVSMVYDTSVDNIFSRKDVNYVVPNVSILDTYN